MRVGEAIERIRFYTGTLSDLSGKAVNNLFTNKNIIYLLMTELNQYANITKAIEDIYSFTLNTQVPFVPAPSLALRSEAYKYINVIVDGRYFGADISGLMNTYQNFPVRNINGITNWLLPWGFGSQDYLYIFPLNANTPGSTAITADITPLSTTIPVVSTAGFTSHDGRITIGNEKILYMKKDLTNFYGCVRGIEGTIAEDHLIGVPVYENNVYLYYSRRHTPIPASGTDNFVSPEVSEFELEVPDEHVEGILKATSYNLLLKIDPSRAEPHKIDSAQLYEQYRLDIKKGRSRIRQGANIRMPYMMENGQPMYTNLL